MELKDCVLGLIVKTNKNRCDQEIGMIIGITNDSLGSTLTDQKRPEHAIPLVRWSCGSEQGVHLDDLEKL